MDMAPTQHLMPTPIRTTGIWCKVAFPMVFQDNLEHLPGGCLNETTDDGGPECLEVRASTS